MSVTEVDGGLHGLVDARLSEAQVRHACDDLGASGDAVWRAWQARVGLNAVYSAT